MHAHYLYNIYIYIFSHLIRYGFVACMTSIIVKISVSLMFEAS